MKEYGPRKSVILYVHQHKWNRGVNWQFLPDVEIIYMLATIIITEQNKKIFINFAEHFKFLFSILPYVLRK